MSSSASNSRLRLQVTCMFLTCLVLVTGWHLLIVSGTIKPGKPSLFLRHRDISIHNYAASRPGRYPIVMIGSSWLESVGGNDVRNVPDNWFNLCLGGLSSEDGCDVILSSGVYPKTLIVEASEQIRRYAEGNHEARIASSPFTIGLIKLSPIFKEEYQPSTILLSILGTKTNWHPPRAALAAKKREAFIKSRQSPPSELVLKEVRTAAGNLRDKLLEIQAHGTAVLIVEVPRDREILDSYQNAIIDTIQLELPENQFHWYRPARRNWLTTDGAHLSAASSREFAVMLVDEVQERGLNK